MTEQRKVSLSAGILYLLTFASIPTLSLYSAAKDSHYLLSSGAADANILLGGLLEIVVALACIGTAVALYPVLKKQSTTLSVGLITSRVLEAGAIFIGVAMMLSLVALRQSGAGAESLPVAHALTTLYDKIFLVSQSFLPAVNDLLLGILLYKSRLVPRSLSAIGIFGAFPLTIAFVAMLLGGIEQGSPAAGLAALPVALFELVLGLWLTFKGFNQRAVAALEKK